MKQKPTIKPGLIGTALRWGFSSWLAIFAAYGIIELTISLVNQ